MTRESVSLLFLSPCRPMAGGSGVAMRAQATCERLARRSDVTVVTPDALKARVVDRCRRWLRFAIPSLSTVVSRDPWDWTSPTRAVAGAAAACRGPVDRVHVFRFSMAPWAAARLGRCRCDIDLDESESRTRRDIAALARRNRHHGLAAALTQEADFYERAEREWLPRFDRIFAASRIEADKIAAEMPGVDVSVVPNVVPLPDLPPRNDRGDPFTLLFVGTLGYYPNHDAVCHLVRHILPLWHDRKHGPLRVIVAGQGASRGLRRLMAREPRIEHGGFVADLSGLYGRAGAVVVPLRAGGGTRLKILESFAWRVPVVATRKAAEGIDVRDGEQILLADSPEEIVHACERLRGDSVLRASLAAAGRRFVEAHHAPAALAELD